jgi:hypothetical protein
LSNDEDQQSQYVLQHHLFFGTLTLPPGRWSGNQSIIFRGGRGMTDGN